MSNAYQTLGAALTVVCVYSRCRLALSLHSAANAVELEAEGDHNTPCCIKPAFALVASGWNGKADTHNDNYFAEYSLIEKS